MLEEERYMVCQNERMFSEHSNIKMNRFLSKNYPEEEKYVFCQNEREVSKQNSLKIYRFLNKNVLEK